MSHPRPGAIIVHDNLLWDSRFAGITTSGAAWQNVDRLLTPQLQPKASHGTGAASTTLQVNFNTPISARGDYAVALLGTNVTQYDLRRAMLYVRFRLSTATSPSNFAEPYLLDAPDGTSHIVSCTANDNEGTFDSIWITMPGDVIGEGGSLYVGRYRQSPELADSGWGITYPDRVPALESYGGQIYPASALPAINRELRVPMATIEDMGAFASPGEGRPVTLPAPVLAGNVTINAHGFLQISTQFGSGSATFPDAFDDGDEYARVDYWAYVGSANAGNPGLFRWMIDQHEPANGPLKAVRGSAIIALKGGDLTLSAVEGTNVSQHCIRIERVTVIPRPHNVQWHPDDSLAGIYARHGNVRPIIVMQRPGDPLINQATGLYGYIQDTPAVRHDAGPYFGSELVVREQR